MANRIILSMRLVGFLLLGGLAVSTLLINPQELGPFGITAWFSAMLIALSSLLSLWLWQKLYELKTENLLLALRRGFMISVWLVALLALNSLRQLNIRDIILVIILGLLVDFYLRRIER